MDLGFIIFVIIASVVGNMIKESKKQQRNTRSNTGYAKPNENARHSYSPPARTASSVLGQKELRPASHVPTGKPFFDTFGKIGELFIDEGSTLEGQRKNIGETYESTGLKTHSDNDKPILDKAIEGNESPSISYKRISFEDEDDSSYSESVGGGSDTPLGLRFDRENVIRGIVLAEVLGPPKCRRR